MHQYDRRRLSVAKFRGRVIENLTRSITAAESSSGLDRKSAVISHLLTAVSLSMGRRALWALGLSRLRRTGTNWDGRH